MMESVPRGLGRRASVSECPGFFLSGCCLVGGRCPLSGCVWRSLTPGNCKIIMEVVS